MDRHSKSVELGRAACRETIYSDMRFYDAGPAEDCLYLNLWMPEAAYDGRAPEQIKLPVMHMDLRRRFSGKRYYFRNPVRMARVSFHGGES